MKLGRNDLCPCGSGKKYKHCCLNKPDTDEISDPDKAAAIFNDIMRNRFIKQCIYPQKSECSERIIRAHSIQNNRILSKLAVDGYVITLSLDNMVFMKGTKTGRKNASVFTGFCSYHDQIVFSDIDCSEFLRTAKQLFLFAYRAFALEYHRKLEQLNSFQKSFSIAPARSSKSTERLLYYEGLSMGIKDNESTKEIFDQSIVDENYHNVNSYVWEMPMVIEFAVTTATGLIYDIAGNKINDFYSQDRIRHLFINIFPSNEKSYLIFSWLKIDDIPYSKFSKQFDDLSIADKKKYLNNFITMSTENIIFSPRLWDKWTQSQKDDFHSLFNMNMLLGEDAYKNFILETHFDLFAT